MGLSVAISGGIIMITFLSILSTTIPSLLDTNTELVQVSSEKSAIDNEIYKTNVAIESATADASTSTVDITLSNTGSIKLYDYQKFDVIVTYDTFTGNNSISGPKATESLLYDGIISSSPQSGHWNIRQFNQDLADPEILNSGEEMAILCKLGDAVFDGGIVSITISTDNGTTASASVEAT